MQIPLTMVQPIMELDYQSALSLQQPTHRPRHFISFQLRIDDSTEIRTPHEMVQAQTPQRSKHNTLIIPVQVFLRQSWEIFQSCCNSLPKRRCQISMLIASHLTLSLYLLAIEKWTRHCLETLTLLPRLSQKSLQTLSPIVQVQQKMLLRNQ